MTRLGSPPGPLGRRAEIARVIKPLYGLPGRVTVGKIMSELQFTNSTIDGGAFSKDG